ncbi:helix-turn-helix domain-containing protein [Halocola ammonii]
MKSKKDNKNLTSLEQLTEKYYGKVGTPKRDKLEADYEDFKLGVLIKEARISQGMTQEELAQKIGSTKSYISKIENNIKEVRFSTLKKIVELGLGAELQLSIKW